MCCSLWLWEEQLCACCHSVQRGCAVRRKRQQCLLLARTLWVPFQGQWTLHSVMGCWWCLRQMAQAEQTSDWPAPLQKPPQSCLLSSVELIGTTWLKPNANHDHKVSTELCHHWCLTASDVGPPQPHCKLVCILRNYLSLISHSGSLHSKWPLLILAISLLELYGCLVGLWKGQIPCLNNHVDCHWCPIFPHLLTDNVKSLLPIMSLSWKKAPWFD